MGWDGQTTEYLLVGKIAWDGMNIQRSTGGIYHDASSKGRASLSLFATALYPI